MSKSNPNKNLGAILVDCVPHMEIVRRVTERSKYLSYEVQDVLDAYFTEIAEIMATENKGVVFKGIGRIRPRIVRGKLCWQVLTGGFENIEPTVTLKADVSPKMKQYMNARLYERMSSMSDEEKANLYVEKPV